MTRSDNLSLSLPRARSIQSVSPTHFLKTYRTLIYTQVFQVVLPFRSPQQNPVCTSSLLYTCYITRPSHSSWFDHPNSICWGVHIIKFFVIQSSLLPITSYLLGRNTLFSFLFSDTISFSSSLNLSDQVSHSYKTTEKFVSLYILFFNNATTCSYELSWFPSWLWR